MSTQAKDCPQCGAPSPARGATIALGVSYVISALFLISACSKHVDRGDANSTVATPPASVSASVMADAIATPPLQVSAQALWQAYEANEVAASRAYQGKSLLVTGTVGAISKNAFDNVVVQLSTPNPAMSVHATVQNSSEKNKAAALSKGQSVSVSCIGGTVSVGSPVLSYCRIEG